MLAAPCLDRKDKERAWWCAANFYFSLPFMFCILYAFILTARFKWTSTFISMVPLERPRWSGEQWIGGGYATAGLFKFALRFFECFSSFERNYTLCSRNNPSCSFNIYKSSLHMVWPSPETAPSPHQIFGLPTIAPLYFKQRRIVASWQRMPSVSTVSSITARSASVRWVMWSKVGRVFRGTCQADFDLFAFWLFLSAAERMTPVVIGAILSLSFWVSLYCILCCVNGSRSYEWNCRLVTLLHGILAVCITAYIGYVDGPWPFSYPGEDQSLKLVNTASKLKVKQTVTISDPTTNRSVQSGLMIRLHIYCWKWK